MLVWGRISPGGEARQLVDVAVVVGEGRLDQDPLARVVRREGVDHGRGAGDVGVPADVKPDPLVAVARTGQPVFVVDAGGGRGERVPHLVLAGDDRAARGCRLGLFWMVPEGGNALLSTVSTSPRSSRKVATTLKPTSSTVSR